MADSPGANTAEISLFYLEQSLSHAVNILYNAVLKIRFFTIGIYLFRVYFYLLSL